MRLVVDAASLKKRVLYDLSLVAHSNMFLPAEIGHAKINSWVLGRSERTRLSAILITLEIGPRGPLSHEPTLLLHRTTPSHTLVPLLLPARQDTKDLRVLQRGDHDG